MERTEKLVWQKKPHNRHKAVGHAPPLELRNSGCCPVASSKNNSGSSEEKSGRLEKVKCQSKVEVTANQGLYWKPSVRDRRPAVH